MVKKKMTRKKIGIMISGAGTNMQAIVRACELGNINADIAFVGTDNLNAKGLEWAKRKNISIFAIDYHQASVSKFVKLIIGDVYRKSTFVHELFDGNIDKQKKYLGQKLMAEIDLIEKLKKYGIELLVLAGFMQICTSYLIDFMNYGSMDPRIMNIHPALLPSFPGGNGYADTINYGCKVGGCTVHFVDYGKDTGPIIGQSAIPVLPKDNVCSFQKRGLEEEYKLYPQCIQLFMEGRLQLKNIKNLQGDDRKIVQIL